MNEETTTQTAEATTGQTDQQTQPVTPALFDEPQEQTPSNDLANTSQENQQGESESNQDSNQAQQITLTEQDITIPEGFTYDKELGDSFLNLVNESKLSKEQTQKFVDMYHAQNLKMLNALKAADEERAKKFEADMTAEKSAWLEQCKADKEFGGQNWEAAQAIIDKGCRQLATPEAVNLMQRYNLNTHPEIVRMFYRAGKLAGEDSSTVQGGAGKTTDIAMSIWGESLKDYHRRKGEI